MMETKLDSRRIKRVTKKFGYDCGIEIGVDGSHKGLALAWKENITVDLRSFSAHHVDVVVIENDGSLRWRLTSFYGVPFAIERKSTWDLLSQLGHDQLG